MPDTFYEIIPKQTDEQVREYITNHKRYTKECVEFAASELAKRGHALSSDELAKIREDVRGRDAQYQPHPEDNYSPSSAWKRNIPPNGVLPQTYEITSQSQMFILKQLARYPIPGLVVYYAYTTWIHPEINGTFLAVWLTLGIIVLECVPSAILHFQYRSYNQGMKVALDQASSTLTIINRDSTSIVRLGEAKKVEVVMNPFFLKGQNGGMDAWNVYHHAVITNKDGKRLIITCLLVNDLRVFFHVLGIKVWKVKRVFPRIKFEESTGAIPHATRGA